MEDKILNKYNKWCDIAKYTPKPFSPTPIEDYKHRKNIYDEKLFCGDKHTILQEIFRDDQSCRLSNKEIIFLIENTNINHKNVLDAPLISALNSNFLNLSTEVYDVLINHTNLNDINAFELNYLNLYNKLNDEQIEKILSSINLVAEEKKQYPNSFLNFIVTQSIFFKENHLNIIYDKINPSFFVLKKQIDKATNTQYVEPEYLLEIILKNKGYLVSDNNNNIQPTIHPNISKKLLEHTHINSNILLNIIKKFEWFNLDSFNYLIEEKNISKITSNCMVELFKSIKKYPHSTKIYGENFINFIYQKINSIPEEEIKIHPDREILEQILLQVNLKNAKPKKLKI